MDIKNLLMNGEFEKVIEILDGKAKSVEDFNALGVAYYGLGKRNKAVSNFKKALSIDPKNYDAHFNLAEIYIQLEKYEKAKEHALNVIELNPRDWAMHDILSNVYAFEGFFDLALEHLKKAINYAPADASAKLKEKLEVLKERIEKAKNQKKLAIICAKGLDNFIDDIIKGLSDEYWVQRWAVTTDREIKQAIDWADIVWFEWANEVAIIGTNYTGILGKPTVVRLHGYESLRKDFLEKIDWRNVSNVIFVAKNVMETAVSNCRFLKNTKKVLIYNGVDLNKYRYRQRKKGHKIAFLGHFNYKKNPILAIQILKKLVDIDKAYKLYWAGTMQDERIWRYINYILKDMKIRDHFIFEGWVEDTDEWLDDKNIFLSTSIHEGYGMAIMEAMAKGIKPIVHNFYIAKEFYPEKYIFNTVDEAVDMIIRGDYNSKEYLDFVSKYSLENQIKSIKDVLHKITHTYKKPVLKLENNESVFRNIVLITVDTLRYDELVGIEDVLNGFIIFSNVFTSGTSTPFAFPGILGGVYFSGYRKKLIKVPEFFKANNYITFGHNGGNIYCSDVWGYKSGFDYFEEKFIGRTVPDVSDHRIPSCWDIIKEFKKWFENTRNRNFFAWLHFMDLHGRWDHFEYLSDEEKRLAELVHREFRKMYLEGEHLEALKRLRKTILANLKKCLSDVFSFLREFDATIIITSDHGEELMEHGNVDHLPKPYDEIVHVPLAIFTGDEDVRSKLKKVKDNLISLVDLPLLIFSISGFETGSFGVGVNPFESERKYVYCEGFRDPNTERHDPNGRGIRNFCVRTKEWKYMRIDNKEIFFDLRNDPTERHPLQVDENIRSEIVKFLENENKRSLAWLTKANVISNRFSNFGNS